MMNKNVIGPYLERSAQTMHREDAVTARVYSGASLSKKTVPNMSLRTSLY